MSVILETRNLRKAFGAVFAADDINVTLLDQEAVGVIGANGAGKTSFVNMVTGYLTPTSGTILFRGRDITGFGPKQATGLGICRSFQIPQLFESASVSDNLMMAIGIAEASGFPLWQPLYKPDRIVRCRDVLRLYQISDYRAHPASALPHGVRKLLDIAMASVHQPRLLMLDEPTSGIPAAEKFDIMDIIFKALREQEVTVLFVEHDMDIVRRYATRVLAFYEGRVIADGEPAETLAQEDVRRYVIGDELVDADSAA